MIDSDGLVINLRQRICFHINRAKERRYQKSCSGPNSSVLGQLAVLEQYILLYFQVWSLIIIKLPVLGHNPVVCSIQASSGLGFFGLVSMIDPLRAATPDAVRRMSRSIAKAVGIISEGS
uniref:Uncharacterized protein n=1 Tax=Tetranychus urticae TaxID=32264 RepID=T1L049_TETUR